MRTADRVNRVVDGSTTAAQVYIERASSNSSMMCSPRVTTRHRASTNGTMTAFGVKWKCGACVGLTEVEATRRMRSGTMQEFSGDTLTDSIQAAAAWVGKGILLNADAPPFKPAARIGEREASQCGSRGSASPPRASDVRVLLTHKRVSHVVTASCSEKAAMDKFRA